MLVNTQFLWGDVSGLNDCAHKPFGQQYQRCGTQVAGKSCSMGVVACNADYENSDAIACHAIFPSCSSSARHIGINGFTEELQQSR